MAGVAQNVRVSFAPKGLPVDFRFSEDQHLSSRYLPAGPVRASPRSAPL